MRGRTRQGHHRHARPARVRGHVPGPRRRPCHQRQAQAVPGTAGVPARAAPAPQARSRRKTPAAGAGGRDRRGAAGNHGPDRAVGRRARRWLRPARCPAGPGGRPGACHPAGAPAGTGLPACPCGPRHPRGTQLRDIPWLASRACPCLGWPRRAGGTLPAGARSRGSPWTDPGGHIGVLPGRVRPPLLRGRGDLITRQTHVGSVSLRAAPNALSGVFPGRCRGDGVLSGSPGGRDGSTASARRPTTEPQRRRLSPRGHRPDLRGRPWLAAALIALTAAIPGRYPPLGVCSHLRVDCAPAAERVIGWWRTEVLSRFRPPGAGKVPRPVAYVKAMTVRTFCPKAGDVQRQWHVIDANDVVLGRLAARSRFCCAASTSRSSRRTSTPATS